MTVTRTWTHAARPWTDPETGRQECRVCGDPYVGTISGPVHQGERVPHVVAERPRDLPVLTAALDAARAALAELPEGVSDADAAQAVVRALYARGALGNRLRPVQQDQPLLFAV